MQVAYIKRRMVRLQSELLTLAEDIIRMDGAPEHIREETMTLVMRSSANMNDALNRVNSVHTTLAGTTLAPPAK